MIPRPVRRLIVNALAPRLTQQAAADLPSLWATIKRSSRDATALRAAGNALEESGELFTASFCYSDLLRHRDSDEDYMGLARVRQRLISRTL